MSEAGTTSRDHEGRTKVVFPAELPLLPVLDLRLTHKGRPLLAGDHFSDHNIKHGSTIECTLRRSPMRRRLLLRPMERARVTVLAGRASTMQRTLKWILR